MVRKTKHMSKYLVKNKTSACKSGCFVRHLGGNLSAGLTKGEKHFFRFLLKLSAASSYFGIYKKTKNRIAAAMAEGINHPSPCFSLEDWYCTGNELETGSEAV